jgi:uncharacterized protein (DUF1697 family)
MTAHRSSTGRRGGSATCRPDVRRYGAFVRYVALLRGINVGGKTLIKMADLRTCVEALGLDDVSTVIASGYVLFESGRRDAATLEAEIQRAIEQRFGCR